MRWPWKRSGFAATVLAGRKRHAESGVSGDPLLAFAQGYASASGARTRWNGNVLQATLAGGTVQNYTTAVRDGDAQATLLVLGSDALTGMLAEVESRARVSSLRLPRAPDPETLVRQALSVAPKDCGRCLSIGGNDVGRDMSPNVSPCEGCPLLADDARFVVSALPRRGALRIDREEMAASVELTFRVSARDRGGRTDDVARLAFDASGGQVEVLTSTQARDAAVEPLAQDISALAASTYERAEELLRPALDATGAFLRIRSADAYRKRLDDLTATYDRLRREQPDDEHEALASLQRELAALAEVYATDVQATLESICFVTSPVAQVFWSAPNNPPLTLTVDASRGTVSAVCASCGTLARRGVISQNGRALCDDCLSTTSVAIESRATGAAASQHKKSAGGNGSRMTTQQLAAMAQFTPRLWSQCAAWLLGSAGYRVADADSKAAIWHASRDGHPCLIAVSLGASGRLLTARDVRQIGMRAEREGAQALLFTLARASDEVRALAQKQGVELLDQAAVDELLAGLVTAGIRSAATANGAAKERVAAAIKTRAALLKALDNAADALLAAPNAERVAGAAALSAALASLDMARQSAAQAFLAWETLVAGWLTVFPERVTPSGGLVIDAEKEGLRELRDRAAHLGKALVSVFEQLNRAPVHGELGYDIWRAALLDEHKMHCAALRARIAAIDPAEWEDARRARSAEAESAAERAGQEARHAAARAAKAYAQVVQLLGKRQG